ncbi:MAG: SDR family oxidoreductase [Rhodospirillaceae bacterium]|nr:SDR family oxidoreductase [Rhodospirillaceae bacterium]
MIDGRNALVTNVRHFVGAAAARELVRLGGRVFCHDLAFDAAAARDAFAATAPGTWPRAEQGPDALIGALEAEAGPLEILVNNDFHPAVRAPIEDADPAELRRGFEALAVAPFRFAAAAAARMKTRRRGKIVFVTSAAPLRGLPNYSMYATARGAANALMLSLAQELAPFNIQVNAVAPNYVASPSYFPPELTAQPEAMKKFAEKVPLKRLGTPDEVAAAIGFLVSPGSDFITGHVLPVAGGWA